MTTTLSSKGQVVIPSKIRQQLALAEGAVIECEVQDGKIILNPSSLAPRAQLVQEKGRPVLKAPKGAPKMTPELVQELLNS
jgi:AbrB family looped-hinge helix DNA binding protein